MGIDGNEIAEICGLLGNYTASYMLFCPSRMALDISKGS
jgi:hypothetical protein